MVIVMLIAKVHKNLSPFQSLSSLLASCQINNANTLLVFQPAVLQHLLT